MHPTASAVGYGSDSDLGAALSAAHLEECVSAAASLEAEPRRGAHMFRLTLPEYTTDRHFARDTGLPLVTFVQSGKRQAWGREEPGLG